MSVKLMSQALTVGVMTDWQGRVSGLFLLPTQNVHSPVYLKGWALKFYKSGHSFFFLFQFFNLN